MRLSIIGCGYVGLVTGSCLAEIGHTVVCADNDPAKYEVLRSGRVPIYEPFLEEVIARNRREGRLEFTGDPGEAIRAGEAVFICVGTPPLENGEADLSAIDRVARLIAGETRTHKLVIEKSTVPVRTGQELKRALGAYSRGSGAVFQIASNPEFLREGTAVGDFLHPDRIVVGVEDGRTEEQLREIYRPVIEGSFNCPVHSPKCPPVAPPAFLVTTIASAELIKHASNSFLALKISYANAIAELCERLGADVGEVTRAMGLDPRIGPQFLHAGLGFGGFCLPKDIQAFIRLAERAGMNFALLKEAERINSQQVERFLEKLRRALWVLPNKQVAVLGLAFKPHTDDIRYAPAIKLIERLTAEGTQVRAYDPKAMEKTRAILPGIRYCDDAYETARDADALVVATEWPEFAELDWKRIAGLMARPLVLDGRNLLAPTAMHALGFEYYSMGRPDQPVAATPTR